MARSSGGVKNRGSVARGGEATIDLAARVRELEAELEEARARIRTLEEERDHVRNRIDWVIDSLNSVIGE